MKVYVQGDKALIPLQEDLTADNIKNALGYTPADDADLETHKGDTSHITDAEREAWNNKPDLDCIDETADDALYVTDSQGNILFKVDSESTSAVDVKVGEDQKSVAEHIEDGDIHTTPEEKAVWNDKSFDSLTDSPISSDDDKVFYIVDNSGNILFKIDESGAYATELYIGTDGVGISEAIKALQDAGYLTEVPSEYITESELEAKGYLTEVPSEYITETELEQKGYLTEHQSLDGYAKTEEIPSALSELTDDADHRTVTDTEKTTWNNKVDASTYNTHKADYEEHKADTDIHLGDEIALDDTEHLYIVDSAGNIIAQFDASGLDVAALKLAGIDITDKISTAIADALNGTDNNALQDHINSTDIHVSESDRTTWNNKLDASTYEDFTNEYISHKNDFEAVQIWQQGVAEGTTTVPVADVSNGADGDLKELLNIMIYYAKGYKHSGSGTGTPEATQTTDGYACDVDIEFSSLATVESAELQSYTGFNAEPTVTINGNIVRVSGFSNIAGSSGAGFSLQCGATVSALLAPKVLA